MVVHFPEVDPVTGRLTDVVRERLATDFEDRSTPEGAAVAAVAARAPFEPEGLSEATRAGLEPAGLSADTNAAIAASIDTAISGDVTNKSVARAAGFAAIGDSITAFDSAGGDAWHKVLATLSNGRLRWMGQFATGGYTLAQIEAEHLAAVLALPTKPGAVVVAGGTNDVGSAQFDATASHATLLRIIDTLQANGIMPVLWAIPPRDDSTTVNTLVQKWNVWVRYLAQSRGLPLVDAHAALTDPATGLYLSTLKLDSVHPNRAGHYQIGKRAATDAAFLSRFPDGTPHLSDSKLDAASMVPSGYGLFDSGANGAGVPTGWSGYGQGTGFTPSIVTDAAIPGNWFRMTKMAGMASGGGLQLNLTTGWAVGDRLAFSVRVASSADDSGAGLVSSLSMQMRSAGVTTASSVAYGSGGTFQGIAYVEAVVPSGTDTVRLDLSVSGTPAADSYAQIAQATLLNLTVLGVA